MNELIEHLQNSVTSSAWKKVGISNHHGINFPLSALHSKNSCGIGEFFDLLPMIDWCCQLKIHFIQLLPLNNSETDPSPYNAISSCALNIVYLSLHALPFLDKELTDKLSQLQQLCLPSRIPYQQVYTHKMLWLHTYFDQVGDKLIKTPEFQKFAQDNPWIQHYALFRALSERLGNAPISSWPQEAQTPTPDQFQDLLNRYTTDVSFYTALQYLCYTQLKSVKDYANKKNVLLMGDLPILVSLQSADVWQYPHFFNTHLQAGAPPDMYNQEGQNWGFPIYNWQEQKKTQYQWWKQRLKYAENFFNICRIDHVLGFFRIWAIPPGESSKNGSFVPPDEKEWEPQGKELLTMLAESTSMLPIAEDLGLIPNCVRPTLKELGICGTKVMRWERKWEEDGHYLPIQYYMPLSITCVSTHDSEPLAQWWTNFPEEAKAFADFKHWNYEPVLTNKQRQEILWDSHHTASFFHANLLQEYLDLFPEFSWPELAEERINIPGQTLETNWTFRFRPSVEELTGHHELQLMMEKILFSLNPLS